MVRIVSQIGTNAAVVGWPCEKVAPRETSLEQNQIGHRNADNAGSEAEKEHDGLDIDRLGKYRTLFPETIIIVGRAHFEEINIRQH